MTNYATSSFAVKLSHHQIIWRQILYLKMLETEILEKLKQMQELHLLYGLWNSVQIYVS